jgi:hypothetical protein
MPKPSIITPEKVEQVSKLITAGNDIEVAAHAAGISKSTHYAWILRGKAEKERLSGSRNAKPKKSEELFVEYMDATEKALNEAEARLVLLIAKAAETKKDWRAAAWLLTHRTNSKDRWKEVSKTELSGENGEPIKTESTANLGEQDIIALANRLSAYNLPITNGEDTE